MLRAHSGPRMNGQQQKSARQRGDRMETEWRQNGDRMETSICYDSEYRVTVARMRALTNLPLWRSGRYCRPWPARSPLPNPSPHGDGPACGGFFVPPASPASLPSVVLTLCPGPILGPELTGNNRMPENRQTPDRLQTEKKKRINTTHPKKKNFNFSF